VDIRPFRLADIDRILEIERASFGRDAWPRSMFLDFARHCPDLFLVLKSGRRIAGYSITCTAGEKAELTSIAVDPRVRRQGLAQALLDHSAAELRRRRVRWWWLMVRVDNEAAIAFYRGYGFVRVRRVRDYYEDGESGYRMRLDLRRRSPIAPGTSGTGHGPVLRGRGC
jgi:[ribosomal protein S18]-alanine N-acetyltransferase